MFDQLKFVLACLVLGVASMAWSSEAHADGADRLAVVDLREVLDGIDERKQVEAATRQARTRLESERASRYREIESLREELNMYAEGSDARRAKQDEIVLRQAELEAYLKVQMSTLQRDAGEMMEAMRGKMVSAVQTVAEANNIQVVITKSVQVTMAGPDGKPRSVPAPQVIWSATEADITDEVIEQMNKDYQSSLMDLEQDQALAMTSEAGNTP